MTQTAAVITRESDRQRDGWDNPDRGILSWVTLFSSEMTPTAAMSAGIMEIPPNGGILKPHRHEQAELYFVHEGKGVLTIDGMETAVSVGMAAFIPGNAEHSLRNDSSEPLKIFYVFPTDSFLNVVYRFPEE